MSKVAIITDSNAGISIEQAKELGIYLIPMPFIVGGETYFEGISIDQKKFYELLENNVNVSTSQPAIGSVVAMWDELLKEYDEIVEIPMSSSLSMECQTASIFASEEPYKDKVFVVDNTRISVTQRLSVLDALRLAKEGKSGSEIKTILENDAMNSSIYIVVDDLKYLKKGGRVTAAGAALGALLGIKPVLQIQGGKLDAFAKVRGIKKAKQVMIEQIKRDVEERYGGDLSKVYIHLAHSNNLVEGEMFLEEAKTIFPGAKGYYLDHLSLSVSCHIGPGSLAITATKAMD